MLTTRGILAAGLGLSRITLASLVVWLAVTCLVTEDTMPAATATAAVQGPESSAEPPASDVELLNGVELIEDVVAFADKSPPVVEVAAAVSGAPAVATGFAFPNDGGGRILAEKLIPPARFDVWPVPFVSQAQTRLATRIDRLGGEVPPLTPALVRAEAFVLPGSERNALTTAALDIPGLARDITRDSPSAIVFSLSPRSFVPSIDAMLVPPLAVSASPAKEKIDPATDPAAVSVESAMLRARLLPAPSPAAFVNLVLPDPFEQIRAIRLTHPVIEFDPPAFPTGRPSHPPLALPVEPAPKK